MGNVSCMEAMILLALGYLKTDPLTKVLAFTEEPGALRSIGLGATDKFEDALEKCRRIMVSF